MLLWLFFSLSLAQNLIVTRYSANSRCFGDSIVGPINQEVLVTSSSSCTPSCVCPNGYCVEISCPASLPSPPSGMIGFETFGNTACTGNRIGYSVYATCSPLSVVSSLGASCNSAGQFTLDTFSGNAGCLSSPANTADYPAACTASSKSLCLTSTSGTTAGGTTTTGAGGTTTPSSGSCSMSSGFSLLISLLFAYSWLM
jgi:hypothetical protein